MFQIQQRRFFPIFVLAASPSPSCQTLSKSETHKSKLERGLKNNYDNRFFAAQPLSRGPGHDCQLQLVAVVPTTN